MEARVLLIAKVVVPYAGRKYGENMQFWASAKDAEKLIAEGQAVRKTPASPAATAPPAVPDPLSAPLPASLVGRPA